MSAPYRVLIAEDDRFLRRAAEVALARRGVDVMTASDGVEALDRARAGGPDLILLDLLMPRLSGIEVLEALREDKRTRRLRVLILSNSSRELDIERGLVAGTDATAPPRRRFQHDTLGQHERQGETNRQRRERDGHHQDRLDAPRELQHHCPNFNSRPTRASSSCGLNGFVR